LIPAFQLLPVPKFPKEKDELDARLGQINNNANYWKIFQEKTAPARSREGRFVLKSIDCRHVVDLVLKRNSIMVTGSTGVVR
jgi:hypothetical protein